MLTFRNLTLDEDMRDCIVNDKLVDLTKNEFDVFYFLLSNRNKVFTRRQIFNGIGIEMKPKSRLVDYCVNNLRKKLGLIGKHLVTKQCFGYGFREKLY